MNAKMMMASAGTALILSACGTTMTERAATGGLAGAAVGAAVDSSVTGALIGGAAGAALGAATTPKDQGNRRQYYDERAGRYYYYDSRSGRYYWEDGSPRR